MRKARYAYIYEGRLKAYRVVMQEQPTRKHHISQVPAVNLKYSEIGEINSQILKSAA